MGIFERRDDIFDDAMVLDEEWQPQEIRKRKDELELYRQALQPVVDNRPLNNIFIYGKTGTGKSAGTRYMLEHLESDAMQYDDVELSTVWVGCENLSTSYQVAVALVNALRDSRTGLLPEREKMSATGYSQQAVFDRLYDDLDDVGGTIVIVFDEIDNIGQSDDLLYGLPRARANGYLEEARPMVIGISNEFNFKDDLSPKVKDTLCEEEILFPPYNADELTSILEPRAEKAFQDNVLEGDVVRLCSALAAQDSGSARQAIRLLSLAGKTAVNNRDEQVAPKHVHHAKKELAQSQVVEGMEQLTTQGHAVLVTLAYYSAKGETPVRTRDLYQQYRNIADEVASNTIVERRVRAHLSDMSMLGLVNTYGRNEGMKDGRYKEHELTVALETVLDVLGSKERFQGVVERIRRVAAKNNQLN